MVMSRLVAFCALGVVTGTVAVAAYAAGTIDLIALLDGNIRTANAGTDVPILLPDTVPASVPRARIKVTTTAKPDQYQFELGSVRGCRHGAKCEIGSFSGKRGGRAGPAGGRRDLVKKVTLLSGLHGFFKPAEIQWVENGFLYDITWKGSAKDSGTVVELANLAIRGGVRS